MTLTPLRINEFRAHGVLHDRVKLHYKSQEICYCHFRLKVYRAGNEYNKHDIVDCSAVGDVAKYISKSFDKNQSIYIVGSLRSSVLPHMPNAYRSFVLISEAQYIDLDTRLPQNYLSPNYKPSSVYYSEDETEKYLKELGDWADKMLKPSLK